MNQSFSWAPLVQILVPLTRQPPSTFVARVRTEAKVAPGVGLAHPDREAQLAAADGRQEALLLGLGAEPVDDRATLAVGHPVVTDRRPPPQQLLDDDEPLDGSPLLAAVALRQRHAQPSPPGRACGKRPGPWSPPSQVLY